MKKGSRLACALMDRRKFLKLMAMACAGAALPWRATRGVLAQLNQKLVTQVVLESVKKGSEDQVLKGAVKNAARAATDFSWLSRGDSVLIKPALNSGNPYPATTSPEAVRAMVELLTEKGAAKVIVSDMSGIEHVKLTPEKL